MTVSDPPSRWSRFVGDPAGTPRRSTTVLKRLVRAVGSRRRAPRHPGAANASTDLLATTVETFDDRKVKGWVVGPPSNFPVRVALYLNDLEVASTWADQGPLNAHDEQVAPFRIVLRGLWKFCQRSDRLTIRVADKPVPISGHEMFRHPTEDGDFTQQDLQAKFAEGYLFGQLGGFQLSKTLDLEWQESVLDLYRRMGAVLHREHGYEPFAIYGSLLGVVRDHDFIGHDLDFDAGYLSRHSDGSEVAAELRDIALTLLDAGFHVQLLRTVLHVRDKEGGLRIDVFPMYFDANDLLAVPFGIAGTTEVSKASWRGLVDAQLGRHVVRAPANGEEIVEHLYGSSWRTPIAGFSWDRARARRSEGGVLPPEYLEEVYWANFYAHHLMTEGSTFFEALNARPDLPRTVLDIGCGDGRDSWAFASAGRRVIGLDRSTIGVRHATERAHGSELGDLLSFVAVDVSDAVALREALDAARAAAGDEPLLLYMRFFLHSITQNVQDALMATLAETARDGDMLAAEFRTDKDEATVKTYVKHYRRFQNGAAFGTELRSRYRFTVLDEEEGTGLAPFGVEDPYLYRVVARRDAS
jgi:SAM-dependent methyltransferase